MRRDSQLSCAEYSGDCRQSMHGFDTGQAVDSVNVVDRIDKSQCCRPLRQYAPHRKPPDDGEAIEDEDGPAVVVLWPGVACIVPVGNDDTRSDGSEDAVAKGAVATQDGDRDDVEDENEDGDDDLREAKSEGVGGEADDLFARHGGGRYWY